jgi:allantoinase
MARLLVRGERVVLPGGMQSAAIDIADGRILEILPYAHTDAAAGTIDAGPLVVMPGIVDTHVHINEPGRTSWEGFDTATRAAAAGGITTLVDMPLNSVPATTTASALEAKRRAAEGQCHVDVGFWGGVVPGNTPELEGLARAGVAGFKCFLSPSGVDEFESVSEADLREAMPVLSRLGLPLLVHAELPQHLRSGDPAADPARHDSWLATRPAEAEEAAVALMIALSREFDVRVHIVHVAAAGVIPLLAAARPAGVSITAETCPHYLTFCAAEIPDRRVDFKCAPPIRARQHREALWEGLRDRVLDLVATDHSPAPPDVKGIAWGDFFAAWGGIASLQLALPAVWTEARDRGFTPVDVSRWMAEAPARLAGFDRRKGRIAPGCDADLVLWDPDAEMDVRPGILHHRHTVTPYAGRRLAGCIDRTILRGATVFANGQLQDSAWGRLLVRGTANIPAR